MGHDVLQLFNSEGKEITGSFSVRQLLKLEQRRGGIWAHRRILGMPGTYWLLSARDGHPRMILRIRLSKGNASGNWGLSWCVNGIADHPHWNIDSAIATLSHGEPVDSEHVAYRTTRIPDNVAALAREHVYYVPGVEADDAPRPQFAIQTSSASDVQSRLSKMTNVDTSQLVGEFAGRKLEFGELMFAVGLFCEEHKLDTFKTMEAFVPTNQHRKLKQLTRQLASQL